MWEMGEDTAFDGMKQYNKGHGEEEEEEEDGAVTLSQFCRVP